VSKAYKSQPATPPVLRKLQFAIQGIDVWLCGLERTTDELTRASASLSPAERVRAERFGTDALRDRWIAGRATLRLLLGNALGIAPAAVVIRRGERGRPELGESGTVRDFNVSHTRDVALFAIARDLPDGARIGADIERGDREVRADKLARKFLTMREQAMLAQHDIDERRRLFLRYWTCKEAMSKATGDGLAAPFRRLDVELDPSPRLRDGPSPYLAPHWTLHDAGAPEPWFATIAIWRRPP
jgi:4'-phosphopantetheinyl transferase